MVKTKKTKEGYQKKRKIGTLSIVYRWENMTDDEKEEIDPMERMGIYCIIFPMLVDVLETYWISCAYFEKWDVIEDVVGDDIILRPPTRTEWVYKDMSKETSYMKQPEICYPLLRTTERYKEDLLNGGMITNELNERIDKCENERRNLIEQKRFLIKDLTNKHINELVSVLLGVKRLSLDHSQKYKDKHQEDVFKEHEILSKRIDMQLSKKKGKGVSNNQITKSFQD